MDSIKNKIQSMYEKKFGKSLTPKTVRRVIALMLAVFLAFTSYNGDWGNLRVEAYGDDTVSVDITVTGIPTNDTTVSDTGIWQLDNDGKLYTASAADVNTISTNGTASVTFNGIADTDLNASAALSYYYVPLDGNAYNKWTAAVSSLNVNCPTENGSVKYDTESYIRVEMTVSDAEGISVTDADFSVAVREDNSGSTTDTLLAYQSVSDGYKAKYSGFVKYDSAYTYKTIVKGSGNFKTDEILNDLSVTSSDITVDSVKVERAIQEYTVKVSADNSALTGATVELVQTNGKGIDTELLGSDTLVSGSYVFKNVKKGVEYKTEVSYLNYYTDANSSIAEIKSENVSAEETVAMTRKTYTVELNSDVAENNTYTIKDSSDIDVSAPLEFDKEYTVTIANTTRRVTNCSINYNGDDITATGVSINNAVWSGKIKISDTADKLYENGKKLEFSVQTENGVITIGADEYKANSKYSISCEPSAQSWKVYDSSDNSETNDITIADGNLNISANAKAGGEYIIKAYADVNATNEIAQKSINLSANSELTTDDYEIKDSNGNVANAINGYYSDSEVTKFETKK